MVEIFVAGFFADFPFQLMDGAGGLNGLNAATLGADQVVLVASRYQQGEIGGALVKTKPADDANDRQSLQQTKHRGFVALVAQAFGMRKFTQSHGSLRIGKCDEKLFKGFGPTQPGGTAAFYQVFDQGTGGHGMLEQWDL